MRKEFLIFLTASICFSVFSQNISEIENITEANNEFAGLLSELPDIRPMKSGTKIVVDYQGNWPEEMKGAFDYATKILEENLPTSLPIKITAKIGSIKGGSNSLSSVTMYRYDFEGKDYNTFQYTYPLSSIKNTVINEYDKYLDNVKFRHITNLYDCLDDTDMTITYNQSKINDFSFNLDCALEDKYDFVTLALRDIIMGLGFINDYTANVNSESLIFDFKRPYTPFEEQIAFSLDRTDAKTAYKNATQGYLYTPFGFLYAPNPFVNGKSLRYFIPEENNVITQLLCQDFKKGYIIRDLSNYDWEGMFGDYLKWDTMIITGSSAKKEEEGSSENVLPYSGSLELPLNSFNKIIEKNGNSFSLFSEQSNNQAYSKQEIDYRVKTLCDLYSLSNDFSKDGVGDKYILSVQLKDGTWEPVWDLINIGQPSAIINFSELQLSKPEEMYARSVTGNLKYRLVKKNVETLLQYISGYYDVLYFTREFTPQKPTIKYYNETSSNQNIISSISGEDDYIAEIEIGMSNLEGIKRLTVEQTFEGDTKPMVFEVKDFRKGKFSATVIKGLSTKFQVIGYNDYGVIKSNEIIVPAIPMNFNSNITAKYNNDTLEVTGMPASLVEKGDIEFVINSPTSRFNFKGIVPSDNKINIDSLTKGIYILSIFKRNGELLYNFKFAK